MPEVATEYKRTVNGYAYNDPTKQNWAFGRRAIPKMVEEAAAVDDALRLQALHSLTDRLHDPIDAAEGLRTKLVEHVKANLNHGDLLIRQHATEIMYLVAESDAGIVQILEKDCIPVLMELFEDADARVQHNALRAVEFVTTQSRFAQKAYAAHPVLLDRLIPAPPSTEPRKKAFATITLQVNCLDQLLLGVGRPAVAHALRSKAQDALMKWIAKDLGGFELRTSLAHTLATICTHVCDPELGPTIAAPGNGAPLVAVLVGALSHPVERAWPATLRAIMALSIHVECKKELVRAGVPDRLMESLGSRDPIMLLNALTAIASVAEDYPARYAFQQAVPAMEALTAHPDASVAKAAASALKVVQWRP